MFARDRAQKLIGSVEVASHDGRLILEHSEKQLVRNDVMIFVARINAIVFLHIAELQTMASYLRLDYKKKTHQIERMIDVRDCYNFAAHIITNSIESGREDEAVANPKRRAHALRLLA